MARPRKVLKFASILTPLSIADLKILKSEVIIETRLKGMATIRDRKEQESRKMRNKIKIGQAITFKQSGPNGRTIEAEVLGIFADKVQVNIEDRKRSVSLTRILSVRNSRSSSGS